MIHKTNKTENTRKLLELMDIFSILIMVMISRMYAYVQTHQNVYIKYINFNINYTSIKLLRTLKKTKDIQ